MKCDWMLLNYFIYEKGSYLIKYVCLWEKKLFNKLNFCFFILVFFLKLICNEFDDKNNV